MREPLNVPTQSSSPTRIAAEAPPKVLLPESSSNGCTARETGSTAITLKPTVQLGTFVHAKDLGRRRWLAGDQQPAVGRGANVRDEWRVGQNVIRKPKFARRPSLSPSVAFW